MISLTGGLHRSLLRINVHPRNPDVQDFIAPIGGRTLSMLHPGSTKQGPHHFPENIRDQGACKSKIYPSISQKPFKECPQ